MIAEAYNAVTNSIVGRVLASVVSCTRPASRSSTKWVIWATWLLGTSSPADAVHGSVASTDPVEADPPALRASGSRPSVDAFAWSGAGWNVQSASA